MEQPITTNAQLVKEQLELLTRLQGVDNEINLRRRQMREIEARVHESESVLSGLRQTEEARKHELEKLTKDRREAERQVKERQEQIAKLGGQLFEVKTNEAYNTLQSEIKQKKLENAQLEERILEMMLSEDELRAGLAHQAGEVKQQQGVVSGIEQEQRREIEALQAQVQALQVQWDEAARGAAPDLLDRYQRLRDAKQGMALAKIENGVCAGCHLALRPQAVIELKKYRALLTCDNCARILIAD